MAFKSNSLLTLSMMIVIASIFCHVFAMTDDQKLQNSFENVMNTLDLSVSNGDWQTIKDPNDPKVVDIAKFAVNSENIISKDVELTLERVLNGRFQVDNDGTTYELTIVAIDFDEESEYKTVVFENSKDNVRKLISFSCLKLKCINI
ncbi:cysteine proteinase inhibitor 4-like [Solanum dulcamara]|uniref:cysteine proteinase inhibitor 4-like n=1 Tax=Solanum dulcamara TaxID=45834 RepID=UPI00248585DC|nr:cysteine proteinase inhibitor 4-like [Solanum dulcamara]